MKLIFGLALTIFSCSENEVVNRRSGHGPKEFKINLEEAGFNLSGSKVSIVQVRGNFIGCADPEWTLNSSKGTIYASEKCMAPNYIEATITEDSNDPNKSKSLKFNSADSYLDSSGNVWTFRMNGADGKVALFANFDKSQVGKITHGYAALQFEFGPKIIREDNNQESPFSPLVSKKATIHLGLVFERYFDFTAVHRGWFFFTTGICHSGDVEAIIALKKLFGSKPRLVAEFTYKDPNVLALVLTPGQNNETGIELSSRSILPNPLVTKDLPQKVKVEYQNGTISKGSIPYSSIYFDGEAHLRFPKTE